MGNGWSEYEKLVLGQIKTFGDKLEKMEEHLQQIQIDIALLKFKSSIWGAIGGGIVLSFALLAQKFLK